LTAEDDPDNEYLVVRVHPFTTDIYVGGSFQNIVSK